MRYTLEGLKIAYDMWMFQAPDNFIYFWHHEEPEGKVTKACLSQWYPCHFVVDGVRYNCAEQYMMAEKARIFHDEETRLRILRETEPDKIKKLGREVRNFDSQVWDSISSDVVIKGNMAKFNQNPALFKFLRETGNKVLVEASPYDKIWGIGMNEHEAKRSFPHAWKGLNKLGFALMEVRG